MSPSRTRELRKAQSRSPCLTGDSAGALARTVLWTMPLPGLFWCRCFAKPQLGPALAGKGGCPSGSRGPSAHARLEEPAAAVAAGRCAKAAAGRLPHTFQCIHITIQGSRARASLPPRGWDGNGGGGAGSGRCRQCLIPSKLGWIEAEATPGQGGGDRSLPRAKAAGRGPGSAGGKPAPPRRPGEELGTARDCEQNGSRQPRPADARLPASDQHCRPAAVGSASTAPAGDGVAGRWGNHGKDGGEGKKGK